MLLTKKELSEYADGPWLTLAEFEKSLKNSAQSHVLQYTQMANSYERRLADMRQKCAFREEALHAALHQVKLDAQSSVERATMQKEDIESQFNRFIIYGNSGRAVWWVAGICLMLLGRW